MGKITEIFPNNLDDKEVGYLIGFFIGDGYSYIHNRHYVVEFYFNSINDKQIKLDWIHLKLKIKDLILWELKLIRKNFGF